MKKDVFDQEELDALARRNDELEAETRQIYSQRARENEMGDEQRAGLLPAALACVALAVCGIGLVQWFVGCTAS